MSEKRCKVLVVESHEASRRKICTWVVRAGYSIYECNNLHKAKRMITNVKPNVVVANGVVDGQSTIQLAKAITEEKLASVILTSKNIIEVPKGCYLVKTDSPKDDVLRKIETALKDQNSLILGTKEKNSCIMKAKTLIMKKYNISEQQAYRLIQKRSMDNSLNMNIVAKKIIDIIENT